MVSFDGGYESANGHSEADAGVDRGLLDLFGLVWRRKGLIAFGLFLGLGLGTLYFFQATPMYESSVEILVVPKDADLAAQGAAGANDVQNPSAGEDTLATHIQLLQSPKVITSAIEHASLDQLPTLAAVIAEGDSAVEFIQEHLDVSRGGEGKAKDASVLLATYSCTSPHDAAMTLDAIVQSYQKFLGSTFESTSKDAVELIEKAMTDLGTDLTQTEEAFSAFRLQAPLVWNGEISLNVHQDRLVKIEESLSEIEIRHTEAKARLEVIREVLASNEALTFTDLDRLALLGGSDVERLNLLLAATGKDDYQRFREEAPEIEQSAKAEYEQLLALLLEERTLLEDFGTDHPDVMAVRQQISLIRRFLKDNAVSLTEDEEEKLDPSELLAAHIGLLRHDLRELEKRRTELRKLAHAEENQARTVAGFELQSEMKEAELARKRELFDAVVARLSEINLIKDYGGFLTEVISPVEEAKEPCSPVLIISLGLGGVFGLFLGASLAYVADIMDRTFRTPEELQQALNLQVMAHIPALGVRRGKATRGKRAKKSAVDQSVVVAHWPSSWQAESFRGLRTALQFDSHSSSCKVVQVTSANPRDGKTTVASNLAVSFANSGKRVLLVDCDLRRPRIGRVFGVNARVGLADVITGEVALDDAVVSSSIDNLSVLPSGNHPPNPSELLTSAGFDQFVDRVRDEFDLVIIDSPPLQAVSDPAVIASRVDGVLMAVRITKHGRAAITHAKQTLSRVGANIIGVVVNASDQTRGFGYGGGYGGGSYGYGYGEHQSYHDREPALNLR